MEDNVGKKAYCFEKLAGGVNLYGEPYIDEVTLVLRMCDITKYDSERGQYIVHTPYMDKHIDSNCVFFNRDELREFFKSFFLKNDVLDFNNGDTCYLCSEMYTQQNPVNQLCMVLTRKETSHLGDIKDYGGYNDLFYSNDEIQSRLSSGLDTGILDELPFIK